MLVFTLLQTLYSGTIRFNILLGAVKPQAEVTPEEIEQVCQDANILDFIKSLPKSVSATCNLLFPTHLLILYFQTFSGFDTEVGNRGSQLSGGQKRMSTINNFVPDI
jgi:ATP-binding cassette, subfamily B (MDR/TAP), member 1